MFRNFALYPLSIFACVCLHAQSARDHRLTLEDLVSVEPMGETALSPDGKTIATVRGGQIVLFSADGGWPVTLTSSPAGKSGVSWSPDSRTIAFVSQGSIRSKAEVPVHPPETTLPRHEPADQGPGHGSRLRQDLGEVVAAPDGAARRCPGRSWPCKTSVSSD